MRTKRIKLYTFYEISKDAQQKAIEQYRNFNYEYIDLSMFAEDAISYLSTVGFKNAELRYSLSYSQGDGLSFSADIDLEYFIKKFDPNTTPYRLAVLSTHIYASCEANNGYYPYAHRNCIDVNLGAYTRGYILITDFTESLSEYIKDVYMETCKVLEKQGYAEIEFQKSDEYIIDILTANNYEFLSDGKLTLC